LEREVSRFSDESFRRSVTPVWGAVLFGTAFAAAIIGVLLHGSPRAFAFGAVIAVSAAAALVAPLPTLAALMVLRPVSEVHNFSLSSGASGSLSFQRWWGFVALLCLLKLAVDWGLWRSRKLLVLLVVVGAVGLPGAVTGPVGGAAVTRWFWVFLAVAGLCVALFAPGRVRLESIAATMALSGVVTLILVAVDPYGQTGSVRLTQVTVSEVSAGYESPHTLAFACLALLAWTFVLCLVTRRLWVKAGGLLVATGLSAVIVLTTIRAAQLGLAVLLVGAAIAFASRRGWRMSGWRALLMVGAVVGLLVAVSVAIPSVRQRWVDIYRAAEGPGIPGTGSGIEFAGSARGYIWKQALIDFRELSPLHKAIGAGFGASAIMTGARTRHPLWAHSEPLELLVSVGVIGTAVVLGLAVLLGVQLARSRIPLRRADLHWLWVIAIATAVAFIPIALLVGFLVYPSATIPVFALFGFVLGLARRRSVAPAPVAVSWITRLREAPVARQQRWAALALGASFLVALVVLGGVAVYTWVFAGH
jgi:O-Antigen ligase